MNEPPDDEIKKEVKEAASRIVEFIISLADMDHRSAVILGAARVDVALEGLLKRVMIYHPGGQDNLFGADRPLGSLSAKIALAHRLGLIEPETEHGLQMLRKMRNDFAHSLETADLSDGPQRNRVRELVRCTKPSERNSEAWSILNNRFSEHLAHFCACLSVLLGDIEVRPQFVEFKVVRTMVGQTPPDVRPI